VAFTGPSTQKESEAVMHRPPIACGLVVFVALSASIAGAQTPATSFTPLSDLGAGLYLNQFPGGLYPGGSNGMPAAHAAAGLARAAAIVPRNTLGAPDPNGKYALISIGMSNTTQEFCSENGAGDCAPYSFMGQAGVHPSVNQDPLVIVDGAEGGKSAAFWDSPTDSDYDRIRTEILAPRGLSELQVEAAWVKVANPGPRVALPNANADAYLLVQQMGNIARALKVRYPNLEQIFLSSRIYAGYATTTLNPEPYAYESGFAVKWLIEAQINQANGGGVNSLAGNLDYASGVVPWIAWGPYLWADGLNPRSDGLVWEQTDLGSDGTHPSVSGRTKVGAMLLDFMLTSPQTQPWFLSAAASDFDESGNVDGDDLTRWKTGFGAAGSATHMQGDANGDKDVDGADFLLWQRQLGDAPASSPSEAIAQVPESSAFTIAASTFLAFFSLRRCAKVA
jgi:hypothetical protein